MPQRIRFRKPERITAEGQVAAHRRQTGKQFLVPPTVTTPGTSGAQRQKERTYYPTPASDYNLKRQWYERYYPGTLIANMPYRTPAGARRGYSWEKMHGRLVKFRQQSRKARLPD